VRKAVWSASEPIRLFRNPENRGDHRTYQSDGRCDSVTVEAVALDDFFDDYVGRIDFMKFDIQGAEAAALAGMSRLLAKHRELRMVMEFWPRGLHMAGHNPENFLRRLLDLDFNVRVVDEPSEQLLPLDVPTLLERLPVAPETDILFTNLYCERTAGAPLHPLPPGLPLYDGARSVWGGTIAAKSQHERSCPYS
jgi:hypothetical protein